MPIVLITGAARGIGYQLCKAALSDDSKVLGSVRSHSDADKLTNDFGENFTPLVFDVSDQEAESKALSDIDELDILINNSGIIGPDDESTITASIDEFVSVFEVNTIAPLRLAQLVLPKLKASNRPAILSISSQMSWMGYAKSDHISYRASKAALNKIMQGLSTDLAPENIPVCVVDPGWVRTDMGGENAENDPSDVAAGIWQVAKKLDMKKSGKFIQWTGEEREY
jgi:NAD(P)-dependent dehydrogenase (short-subunit alcohol dehydrogenase family)